VYQHGHHEASEVNACHLPLRILMLECNRLVKHLANAGNANMAALDADARVVLELIGTDVAFPGGRHVESCEW